MNIHHQKKSHDVCIIFDLNYFSLSLSGYSYSEKKYFNGVPPDFTYIHSREFRPPVLDESHV